MIRFLLRLIGFMMLAAGAAQVIVDGTRSIAAGAVLPTAIGQTLTWLFPSRLPVWRTQAAQALPAWLSESALNVVLQTPTAVILLILGAFVLLLAKPPAQPIGFVIER